MKIVLDTDVLVAAIRSPTGASRFILGQIAAKKLQLVASTGMFLEYEAVLTRKEHLKAAGATPKDVGIILDVLAKNTLQIIPHFLWRPMLKDPDDEMLLEAAVSSQADAIITFNRRDFLPAATKFGIKIETPKIFLERIEL